MNAPMAEQLQRLTHALAKVIRKDFIGHWLQTPSPAFGELKPAEGIDRGEGDRIWTMIDELRSGSPT